MIDNFADPEFFPGKLKMMEKKRPQNFLLTGMSDLSGWKPEWRDEVFAKIRENPQHQLDVYKRQDYTMYFVWQTTGNLCLVEKRKDDDIYGKINKKLWGAYAPVGKERCV